MNRNIQATLLRFVDNIGREFLLAALQYYPKVLKVKSGNLRKRFDHFRERRGTNRLAIGLKADVEYARIQHDGGHTGPHEIIPRFKQALYWPGAKHPVKKVNHPGSYIKPKKFFITPMRMVIDKKIKETKGAIHF